MRIRRSNAAITEIEGADMIVCPTDEHLSHRVGVARRVADAVGLVPPPAVGAARPLGAVVHAAASVERWKAVLLTVAVDLRAAVSSSGSATGALIAPESLVSVLKTVLHYARAAECRGLVVPDLCNPGLVETAVVADAWAETLIAAGRAAGAAGYPRTLWLLPSSAADCEVFADAFERALETSAPADDLWWDDDEDGEWPSFVIAERRRDRARGIW